MKILHWMPVLGLFLSAAVHANQCEVELIVLGTAQDAGAPQLGNNDDPAWDEPSLKRLATSLGLLDHSNQQRFLFEATPDIREQLHRLDTYKKFSSDKPGLAGVFLTHAHIGHYAGLMFFGHESMGAKNLPVYVMPRMEKYLRENGPWEQLVNFQNIALRSLENQTRMGLGNHVSVTPYQVPHRDEYSETVGFVIHTQKRSALFVPDIDSWDLWEEKFDIRIEDKISEVDFAFIDASFYDNNEIPGRDMSQFPHPRIVFMMHRFKDLSKIDQKKIYFIHLNHTNPARFPNSAQAKRIRDSGFNIAQEGDTHCLM